MLYYALPERPINGWQLLRVAVYANTSTTAFHIQSTIDIQEHFLYAKNFLLYLCVLVVWPWGRRRRPTPPALWVGLPLCDLSVTTWRRCRFSHRTLRPPRDLSTNNTSHCNDLAAGCVNCRGVGRQVVWRSHCNISCFLLISRSMFWPR